MGSKGGGAKVHVTEYSMSAHYGLCLAGNVRLRALYFGEKVAWEGDVSTLTAIPISRADLFGGDEKEGGPVGTVTFLPGADDQVMPDHIAARYGRTPTTMPGYRGVVSLFFSGLSAAMGQVSTAGFVWANNNPYLKTLWAKVTRVPLDIGLPNDIANIGDHVNPAHMIWECLTSEDCMGAPTSALDYDDFVAAATIFYNEGFMLSMGWFEQDSVEAFVSEILDHVQATIFINPKSGKWSIKALRGDYDVNTLPLFDESNSKLTDWQRKSIGETINEISVGYTNPDNGEEISVTDQDLANIIAQGGIISTSRDYHGVQLPDLAAFIARRDVVTAAAPLGTGVLTVNRKAWDEIPGGCVRVSNKKNKLTEIVCRVTAVEGGNVGDASIKLNIIEDIFGLISGTHSTPPTSLHDNGSSPPTAADFTLAFTMPAFLVAQYGGQGIPAFPDVFGAVLATDVGGDTFSYDLYAETTDIVGNPVYERIGSRALSGRGQLVADLDAEATSVMEMPGTSQGVGPRINGFALIQGASQDVSEIIFLSDVDSSGEWSVERGMLDTTPHAWPTGTPIWFITLDSPFGDPNFRAPGELVNYKVLPRTSQGTFPLASASVVPDLLTGRTYQPNRPGKVRVNNIGFAVVDATADPSNISVTWANRNRETEETRIVFWEDATVTPPAGQTTTVRIYDVLNNLLATRDGLTGVSYTLDELDFSGFSTIKVNVGAELDSINSMTGHTITVLVSTGGFGLAFGFNFGGA